MYNRIRFIWVILTRIFAVIRIITITFACWWWSVASVCVRVFLYIFSKNTNFLCMKTKMWKNKQNIREKKMPRQITKKKTDMILKEKKQFKFTTLFLYAECTKQCMKIIQTKKNILAYAGDTHRHFQLLHSIAKSTENYFHTNCAGIRALAKNGWCWFFSRPQKRAYWI